MTNFTSSKGMTSIANKSCLKALMIFICSTSQQSFLYFLHIHVEQAVEKEIKLFEDLIFNVLVESRKIKNISEKYSSNSSRIEYV